MRIAVLTRHIHRAGGVETYLEHVVPALSAHGHDVAVWHEFPVPPGVERMLPSAISTWPIGERAIELVAAWKPDVLFLNGLSEPALELRLADVAPTVTFLHAYHGTCISGTKTHLLPDIRPCSRTLGAACLLQYYPRRCGGWHPLSMLTSYTKQRSRQTLLAASRFVTVFSEHMRLEAIAHGVEPSRAIHLPPFVPPVTSGATAQAAVRGSTDRLHLLFSGRMETLKGAHLMIDALARIDRGLHRRLRITFAGDGRERARLEQQARNQLNLSHPSHPSHLSDPSHLSHLLFEFVGWLSPAAHAQLLQTVNLLVFPSIWPEPLGLVGLEAAAAGVPAVAFDVGGIREWLQDNETGRLVPTPASAASLASAIEDCVSDPKRLRSWGDAALARSRTRTLSAHVEALETLLLRAVKGTTTDHARISNQARTRDQERTKDQELSTKDQPSYA